MLDLLIVSHYFDCSVYLLYLICSCYVGSYLCERPVAILSLKTGWKLVLCFDMKQDTRVIFHDLIFRTARIYQGLHVSHYEAVGSFDL